MSVDINTAEIEKGLATFEKGLNWCGYMPYLGRWSGHGRMMYGSLQIWTGVALFAIGSASLLWNKESTTESVMSLAKRTLVYSVHGVVNFGRGYVEQCTWIGLLPLVWDLAGQRFAYDSEPRRENTPISFEMLQKNIEWLQKKFDSLTKSFVYTS